MKHACRLAVLVSLGLLLRLDRAAPPRPQPPRPAREAPALARPISPSPGGYALRDRGVSALFDDRGVTFMTKGWGVRWSLRDAAPRAPRPEGETSAKVHSLVGAPAGWKTGLACFSGLSYAGVREGIDVRLESRPGA